jgi:predicted transcriptional regulator of viral defense system
MSKYELPKDRIFITTDYMRKKYGSYDPNIFRRWVDQGKVEKLRNGVYRNTDFKPSSLVDYFVIANHIYEPSYVSTYTALRYWDVIPEAVRIITSVTTRKTATFGYKVRMTYQQIKPTHFFGYEWVIWTGEPYKVANREKAMIDLAYLEPLFADQDWLYEMRFDEDVLKEEYRWDLMEHYLDILQSEALRKKIAALQKCYAL